MENEQTISAPVRRWYRRVEIAEILTQHGFPMKPRQLEKLAVSGDGPPYRLFRRRVIYALDDALAWAESQLHHPDKKTP